MCQITNDKANSVYQCIPVNKTNTVYLCSSDSLKKKLSALPSPEREVSTVNLKKDVKYGLGEGGYMHSAPTSHLTVLSSIKDAMSVCVSVCVLTFVCVCVLSRVPGCRRREFWSYGPWHHH